MPAPATAASNNSHVNEMRQRATITLPFSSAVQARLWLRQA
jgi:hypothetical protein